LTTGTGPILRWTKNTLTKQSIAFGLEGPVIERLGFGDLAATPGAHLLWACQADAQPADILKGQWPSSSSVFRSDPQGQHLPLRMLTNFFTVLYIIMYRFTRFAIWQLLQAEEGIRDVQLVGEQLLHTNTKQSKDWPAWSQCRCHGLNESKSKIY